MTYRFIEFFVSDYDSLPYLLSLFFWSGGTFPLVALDKILMSSNVTRIFKFAFILVEKWKINIQYAFVFSLQVPLRGRFISWHLLTS